MNLLILVCLTQVVWPAMGIYHMKSRELFSPPETLRNDSYFGYSITYDQEFRQLVVSAPKANDIGVVYDCNIKSKICSPVVNDITRVSKNFTHDYWFGATVKSGPDFVLMCAPRYTEKYFSLNEFGTFGKCYSRAHGRLNRLKSINDKKRYEDSDGTIEGNMDSFGWSIDIASDDSVIIGGPGMAHGRSMVYKTWVASPNFMRTNKETPTTNFGYSVAAGTFINPSLSYAVGSPYGHTGYGEVLFFNKAMAKQNNLKKGIDADVVGSMFGAVLCAAMLYDRKRQDLLVGAPTYASKYTYNQGAVYVYVARLRHQPPEFTRRIVGSTSGSLFGSAIISLGDLNGDKKDEVAIGAPFENEGKGAVYIYSGAELISDKPEQKLPFLQKIVPGPSFSHSFGMSLTSLLDYDENGCKELAIGAPFIDKVVLLRCMASVTVQTAATFPEIQDRSDTGPTNLNLKVCLKVQYPRLPEKITALISTSVEMKHPDARLSGPNSIFIFQTSLDTKQPEYCKDVPFILPLTGNYDIEIYYEVTSKLLNNPLERSNFEASKVILSDNSVLKLQEWASAAGCGKKRCEPDLNVTTDISFSYPDHTYVIGTSGTENFTITLYNAGEVAYDACVRVHIIGARVAQPPRTCVLSFSLDGDKLLCAPTISLRNGRTWNTGIIVLEMKHLTHLDKNITINMQVFDRCKDATSKNVSFAVPLKADPSGIVVKGDTDIGDAVDMKVEDVEINGKNFQHKYTINNNGLTNWGMIDVILELQQLDYVKYDAEAVRISSSTSKTYVNCPLLEDKIKSKFYLCKIDSLIAKSQVYDILVPMYIPPGSLNGILEEQNVTIFSNITLMLDEYGKLEHSMATTVYLHDASVPIEWIVLAVAIGLAILIMIAIGLYKCGFLRRKTKQELEDLRRSVKRQTILRRSTMKTNSNEDQRQNIVDNICIEEEAACVPPRN